VTYQPEYYDANFPTSLQGDVEWYCQRAVQAGGPVLELGCGTGRITLPLAEAGVNVVALDASQTMLAALNAKVARHSPAVRARIRLIEGDMRTFELPERFALIIAPFRALLHNVTEADQLACLERVRQHLLPGGRFAFNVFHPSLEYMAQHAGPLAGVWRWAGTYRLPTGGFVVRSEATRYDTVHQVIHSLLRYDEYSAEGGLTKSSLQRSELAYLYPSDIRRLLAQTGFVDLTMNGDFNGRDFSRDGDELVVEATVRGA
jgi:ubiquinone/menaquinone biosynthesis C-methylase UbiE